VDLIGLNEVDSTFQQELLKERWVRERFYVSDASDSAETLQGPWGNLLLSRFPFHSLYTISMTGASRKTLAGVVDLCVSGSMRRMCVCSVHTSAFPWNVPKRRMQLEELQVTIERELPVSFDDIIIMGDLNLRRPEEEALIPEGYLDLWPAVRSDPGYTFDAVKNKMIGEAWPLASKTRRMRLDRIILKSTPRSSPFWTPESMRLFAHTPVASPIEEDEDEDQERKALRFERERQRQRKLVAFWWMVGCLTFVPRLLKMVVEASFDLFGVNVFRNVDDYLWPSDHFGLVAVLTASLEEESSSE
jgi:endonuclease/exonuclease/phosphatase family metal-dependent hydrolase